LGEERKNWSFPMRVKKKEKRKREEFQKKNKRKTQTFSTAFSKTTEIGGFLGELAKL
jgi:hypothetical protein